MGTIRPHYARTPSIKTLAIICTVLPSSMFAADRTNQQRDLKRHHNGVSGIREHIAMQCANPLVNFMYGPSAATGDAINPIVFTKVVEVGDPVPEIGGNVIFEDIGFHFLTESSTSINESPASIDRNGVVAFLGYPIRDGIPTSSVYCLPTAVFNHSDGQTRLIADLGDPSPGIDDAFIGFPFFIPSTPQIENGRTVFFGGIGDNKFNATFGAWSFGSESNRLEFLEDTGLPLMSNTGAMEAPFFFVPADDATVFWGNIDDPAIDDLRPQGIWRKQNGLISPIAVANNPAPGFPDDVIYGETGGNNFLGTIGTYAVKDDGRSVFTAFLEGPGITRLNDEAIWLETDEGIEVLLREGELTPEGLFPEGAAFASSGTSMGAFFGQASTPISINERNTIIFDAVVNIPGDLPHVPSLWRIEDGQLELMIRGRQRGVAFSVPGDPAPGIENANFFHVSFADVNERDEVLIRALVETNDDIFDDVVGIWADRGNGIELVVAEGSPVPEMPGVVFLPNIGNVRGIGLSILEDDGSILYTGRFIADDGLVASGLFRNNPDGSSDFLLKSRDLVDVAGDGSDIRRIAMFNLGEGSTDTGRKVIEFTFTDGSQGMYTFDALSIAGGPRIDHVLSAPFSGYIDPRSESNNGQHATIGLDRAIIVFNQSVQNLDGQPLDPSAFEIRETGGGDPPTVLTVVSHDQAFVNLTLSRPITLREWTTIIAHVENFQGVPIQSVGDLGSDDDEPDRIDIAFLPGDVDQSGVVSPLDLFAFRQQINGIQTPDQGSNTDFLDIDRNGEISPLDLLRFRQLINGISPATQSWNGESLNSPRP